MDSSYFCRQIYNSMMRIGFDAKRAFHNFTGLGNYSRTLIDTLARYYPDNAYHLYTPRLSNKMTVVTEKNKHGLSVHTPEGLMRTLHPFWRSCCIKNDIKKHNIDIFHGLSHELPFCLPKGVKTVVTIHDLIHERFPEFYPFFDRKIYSLKFKSACKYADVVVAISENTKCDIMDFYGIAEQKIRVIYQSCHPQFYLPDTNHHNFVKVDKIDKVKTQQLPQDYILYVGTVNERKNLLSLVKALQLIENQIDIPLVVVGNGGDYLRRVKNYVNENKINHKVIFYSNMPFSFFPQLYRKAQALVLPSFFEGFGIPIIEALWSNCPVITSKGSCFSEAGGPDSLYIDPNDVEEMAHAIQRVLTDSTLRNQMILRGGAFVQKFHEEKIGTEWERLYRTVLGLN